MQKDHPLSIHRGADCPANPKPYPAPSANNKALATPPTPSSPPSTYHAGDHCSCALNEALSSTTNQRLRAEGYGRSSPTAPASLVPKKRGAETWAMLVSALPPSNKRGLDARQRQTHQAPNHVSPARGTVAAKETGTKQLTVASKVGMVGIPHGPTRHRTAAHTQFKLWTPGALQLPSQWRVIEEAGMVQEGHPLRV